MTHQQVNWDELEANFKVYMEEKRKEKEGEEEYKKVLKK